MCLCRYLDDYILSYRKSLMLTIFPACLENTSTHLKMAAIPVWEPPAPEPKNILLPQGVPLPMQYILFPLLSYG